MVLRVLISEYSSNSNHRCGNSGFYSAKIYHFLANPKRFFTFFENPSYLVALNSQSYIYVGYFFMGGVCRLVCFFARDSVILHE
jgi:hypothetical protein